jgi:four helix bundle protein
MKYDRFEDLPVWNSAIELAARVYQATRSAAFAQSGDLRDQLRRASLSVSNNIAEGFERGTVAELLSFLYIARGSAAEVRSMLRFCTRLLDGAAPSRLAASGQDHDGSAFQGQRSDVPLASKHSPQPSQISNLKSEIWYLKNPIPPPFPHV